MTKPLEYFDLLSNTQKQAMGNLLNVQKDLRVQWMDAMSKAHAAFTTIPGLPENAQTQEAVKQFNTWFSNVSSSAQTASEEALKAQESWISAYEKQLAISRDVLKNVIDLANTNKAA